LVAFLVCCSSLLLSFSYRPPYVPINASLLLITYLLIFHILSLSTTPIELLGKKWGKKRKRRVAVGFFFVPSTRPRLLLVPASHLMNIWLNSIPVPMAPEPEPHWKLRRETNPLFSWRLSFLFLFISQPLPISCEVKALSRLYGL